MTVYEHVYKQCRTQQSYARTRVCLVCEPRIVNSVSQSPDGDNRGQPGTLLRSEIPHGLRAGRLSADTELFALPKAVLTSIGGPGRRCRTQILITVLCIITVAYHLTLSRTGLYSSHPHNILFLNTILPSKS
jgi:hypothetical protein